MLAQTRRSRSLHKHTARNRNCERASHAHTWRTSRLLALVETQLLHCPPAGPQLVQDDVDALLDTQLLW